MHRERGESGQKVRELWARVDIVSDCEKRGQFQRHVIYGTTRHELVPLERTDHENKWQTRLVVSYKNDLSHLRIYIASIKTENCYPGVATSEVIFDIIQFIARNSRRFGFSVQWTRCRDRERGEWLSLCRTPNYVIACDPCNLTGNLVTQVSDRNVVKISAIKHS